MFITGPAGQLEAELERAPRIDSAVAVLCHPHPLYGGSMDDLVLSTVAGALRDRGIGCLRFNFRGVGASEGSHDHGRGEVDDLLAVAAWAKAEYPQAELWLVGYSFGASMVWQSLAGLTPARVLLIAPPNGAMPFAALEHDVPVDAFAGDRDDYVDAEQLRTLDAPGSRVEIHLIEGADHFFSGRHGELAAEVSAAVK